MKPAAVALFGYRLLLCPFWQPKTIQLVLSLQLQASIVKIIFAAIIYLLPFALQAQATVLLLKKNGKTITKYFPGRNFEFITTDGMPVSGRLDLVINDSIYLTYFQLSQVPTAFGTLRTDTTGRHSLAFSLYNIGSLPRPQHKSGKGLLAGAMMLGGLGYSFVNLFNTIRDGDPPFGKDNRGRLLAGIGTATAGFLLSRTGSSTYTLGKTYKLEVVN